MNESQICLICDKPGYHYSVELRAFTCRLDHEGRVVVIFDENGNELVA